MTRYLQYQGRVDVILPSAPANLAWLQPWAEPSRRKLVQDRASSWELAPAAARSLAWLAPFAEPIKRRPVIQPQDAGAPVVPFDVGTLVGWLQAWTEVARKSKQVQAYDGNVVPAPAATPMGWLQTWVEPVRRSRLQVPAPIDVTFYDTPFTTAAWSQPWSEPLRRTRSSATFDGNVFFTPQGGATGFFNLGWLQAWAEPNRARRPLPETQPNLGQVAQAATTSFAWFVPWLDVRRLVRDRSTQSIDVLLPPPLGSLGWLGSWAEPFARGRKFLPLPLSDGSVFFTPAATPMGWFAAFVEPMRRVTRRIEGPSIVIAPPVAAAFQSMAWLVPWNEPRKFRRALLDALIFPLGPFGLPFASRFGTLLAPSVMRGRTALAQPRTRLIASPQRNRAALISPRNRLAASVVRHRIATYVANAPMSQANELQPPQDIGENETVMFDYGPGLGAGVTLTGAQPIFINCTVSLESQVQDPNSQNCVLSQATLVPSKKTGAAQAQWNVLIGLTVKGCIYDLQCMSATSDGQKLSVWVRFRGAGPT